MKKKKVFTHHKVLYLTIRLVYLLKELFFGSTTAICQLVACMPKGSWERGRLKQRDMRVPVTDWRLKSGEYFNNAIK